MAPFPAAFLLALICVVDLGMAAVSNVGVVHDQDPLVNTSNLRNGLLGDTDKRAKTNTAGRQLLPHPPGHHHDEQDSNYKGCLGLTDSERETLASNYFKGKAPPCTIEVDGVVVAGDGSSTASGSDGGSESSGGGSGSSSESNNGGDSSGNNNDGSNNESGGSNNYEYSKYNGDAVDGDDNDESSSGNNSDGSSSGWTNDDSSGNNSGSNNGGSTSNGSDSGSSGNDDGTSSNGNDDSRNGDDEKSVNPLSYFNISDCGTYSNIWVWDLAMSCQDSSLSSLELCQCTSAEMLYQYGELYCPTTPDDPTCPSNCPVCVTCLELLGCSADDVSSPRLPTQIKQEMTSVALPIALGVAAAVATALAASSYYQYKKRNVANGGLGTGFIPEEPPVNTML